jgi:ABC-type phosphate transport system permease subunit
MKKPSTLSFLMLLIVVVPLALALRRDSMNAVAARLSSSSDYRT